MIQKNKGDSLIKSGIYMILLPFLLAIFIGIVVVLASVEWTMAFFLTIVGIAYIVIALALIGLGIYFNHKDD